MSTAVLEMAERAHQLSPDECEDLIEMLEDIIDNAAADAAEAKGDFVPWEEAKERILNAWKSR